jgi:hypothetical protein
MTSRLVLGILTLTTLAVPTYRATAVAQSAAKPAAPSAMASPASDAALIKSAMSAAPLAIAKDATIVAMNDKMEMRTLRKGTNAWTCMADVPNTPGPDPMCGDQSVMEWAAALMGHKDPPKDKMGIAYMLAGGSDASNTDPWAEKPAAGQTWVKTGPHMMVMNIGTHFDGYPTTPGDAKVPFVMYPGTPYAHLMIPVR